MVPGMCASDIMTSQVVISTPDTTIADVAKLMNKFRIGGLPVIESGKLVGIITERCIMRNVIALDKQPSEVKVSEIMIPAPLVTATPDEDISAIAHKMSHADLTRVPIVEGEKLVGIVTNRDVMAASGEFLNILVEQARIKGNLQEQSYTAFGKCDGCGMQNNLVFQNDTFLCDHCKSN